MYCDRYGVYYLRCCINLSVTFCVQCYIALNVEHWLKPASLSRCCMSDLILEQITVPEFQRWSMYKILLCLACLKVCFILVQLLLNL